MEIVTNDSPCKFILFAGQEIKEKVFWHGPFVLDTQEKL
jgi:redox-sensitive bicupin YhaK (pirin superfamily)